MYIYYNVYILYIYYICIYVYIYYNMYIILYYIYVNICKYIYVYIFNAINFPLSTAFAASQFFKSCIFIFMLWLLLIDILFILVF